MSFRIVTSSKITSAISEVATNPIFNARKLFNTSINPDIGGVSDGNALIWDAVNGFWTFGREQFTTSQVNIFTRQQSFQATGPNGPVTTDFTIDLDESQVTNVTINGTDLVMTLDNAIAGGTYIVMITQDTGGPHTIKWDTPVGTYKFSAGVAPVLSSGDGVTDVITFISPNSTGFYGVLYPNFQIV